MKLNHNTSISKLLSMYLLLYSHESQTEINTAGPSSCQICPENTKSQAYNAGAIGRESRRIDDLDWVY